MTVPPPTDPTDIAKGGLWSGLFNSIDVDPNTRAQLYDVRWTTTDGGSIPATRIPYSFPTQAADYTDAPGGYPSPGLLVGFAELSSDQKTAVRFTFDLVSSYTKLKFVETASGLAADAAIRIAHYGRGGSEAYTPSADGRTSGDTFLGGNATVGAQQIGTDGLLTIMHELGHALGLKHGHERALHGALAPNFNDNEFSIMTYASYFGAPVPPPTASVNGSSPQSLMMFDISALQALYGANYDKLGTAERYSWNTTTGQQLIDGQPAPHTGTTTTDKIFSTIWTQGAAATYDLSAFTQNQVDDLRPGHWLKFDSNKLADLNSDDPGAAIAQGNIYNALLYKGDLRSAVANLTTGIGNDTISGGAGADTIYFGPGIDVVRDNLANLNGDKMLDFGFHASVDIVGSLIGRGSVAITPTTATISSAGSTFQLNGDFAGGGNAGGLIIAARGSGDSAHTTLSHVNFLPNLQEGVAVNPATVNGVANQTFLSGDGTVQFTLELKSAVSAFANTLGYYKVAADGTISGVHILFANTLKTASGTSVDLGTPGNGERIGFFLIQNGANAVGALADDLSFVMSGTANAANLNQGIAPTLMSASHGALTGVEIFHSFANINPGAATQVLSGLDRGGRELQIGFEDLRTATADNDFQDVVIGVHTNHNDIFIL